MVFEVITGVKQGCVLSLLIFLMVMDWILRRTTAAIPAGNQWIRDSKLCDLDFANDIVLLADSMENMRKITSELSNQAAAFGLQFNVEKTKIMQVGKNISGEGLTINGKDIEIVDDVCHLGSFISDNGNYNKEIRSKLAKANSIFGRRRKIWANKGFCQTSTSLDFTRHSFYRRYSMDR